MGRSTYDYRQQIAAIDKSEILILKDINRFSAYDTDILCPFLVLVLCHQGNARALYDMCEMTQSGNDLGCILPGHILHPIESSEDYKVTIVIVSQKMYKELKYYSFSHDYNKFNAAPICSLTDIQSERLANIVYQLEMINDHTEEEFPHKHHMLLSLLAVGYEVLNFYRREQDKEWRADRRTELLRRFSDLVVEHYLETREVKDYAKMLHMTPKYFSRTIRTMTNGVGPHEWIEQYVATQAKRAIETDHTLTTQELTYRLGFDEPASFCRFFKRATGYTTKEYRALVSGNMK